MLNSIDNLVTDAEINHLIEFFDDKINFQNPHRYIVYEWFANKNEVKEPECYKLYNITMELENCTIITSDAEGILWGEPHAIHSFLVSNIMYIAFQTDHNMITITLGNDNYDGYIRIYY